MCLISSLLLDVSEFSKRHPGIVLVLLGVIGEGFEIFSKLLFKHWYEKHERGVEFFGGICWLVVVIGLAWEIPEAGKSDKQAEDSRLKADALEWQIAQTSTNVAKIDPRTANISDMSATAILMVMGTDFNDLTNLNPSRVARMTLWKDEKMGGDLDALTAENFTRNDFRVVFGVRDRREYGIRFHSFNFNAANGREFPVKTIDDVHIVRMDLSFLPHDSEIAGGMIELVVNNFHKMFQIPRQNGTNSGLSWEIGFPCIVVATNGVQSSEKQFLYLHD
jgi:hypothetical protein